MNSFLKKSLLPDDPDNGRPDRYGMLSLLKWVIAAGCVLVYLYSLQFLHSGAVLRIAAVGILIAGASLLTGCLLGFIFGIPRNNEARQKDDDSAGAPKQDPESSFRLSTVAPNSNLIEISDWLTKILVGVGLVELNAIPHSQIGWQNSLGRGYAQSAAWQLRARISR